MRLEDLIKGTDALCEKDMLNQEITDVVYDSRRVGKNSLFVAVRGFKQDGHKYIEKAIEMGASVIAGEEDRSEKGYIRVKSARKFLATASSNFFDNSFGAMRVFGITGTNGKTTISYLLKKILEEAGNSCSLIGTNQILIGDEAIESERTTPESRELAELFKKMKDKGSECVVMEVSSHSLELDRVFGINFEVGIFTNLTQDHLDFHETMENYAKAKAKLFEVSENAVINLDDKYAPIMLERAKNVITYSVNTPSDLMAKNIEMRSTGIEFDAEYKGECERISLAIPGGFSVYNALAAIGAALAVNIDLRTIKKALSDATGVKGRLEVVPTNKDYTVIIDYAHTPDGLENVIRAVRGFAKGRVITLFGCGGDRDRTKRPLMGSIAEDGSDVVIVTSDNPRTEDPMAIINDILGGMKKEHIVIESRKDAICHALDIALKDDVIILAGKGHETYQIFKDGTIHFDEREVVNEHLKQKK